MLADSLLPLPRNQLSGVVSPALLATTGIVPLSIFSTGPDIIGHYYDCIVSARQEVIVMTNYWQGGKNVDTIAAALRELDRREKMRKGKGASMVEDGYKGRIVVKLMWDRGPQTLADLFRLRKVVPQSAWKTNGLPTAEEIPNLAMEVLNYHRPIMGTFHAKLLLVDRQVALINSNNIQDRPNLESCSRYEGDIVNAIYDMALISWGNRMDPPLPCLTKPARCDPGVKAFVPSGEAPAVSAAVQHDVEKHGASLNLNASTAAAATTTVTTTSSSSNKDNGGASSFSVGATGDPGLDALSGLTKQKLTMRAREARQRLKMDDEEAEEEKERFTQGRRRRSVGEVVDHVMRRRSGDAENLAAVAEAEKNEANGKEGTASDAQVIRNAFQHSQQASASASPVSASAESAAGTMGPDERDENSRQTARRAGAIWAQKVLGERFKGGFAEGLHSPRSPFSSFSFGNNNAPSTSAAASPSAENIDQNAAAPPMSPTTRRHFADIVDALMKKEGMRPAGWAEGALEVFGIGESSSRNVAHEVRKARKQQLAAHAKNKPMLNIPTSVVEEDGFSSPISPEEQNGPSFAKFQQSREEEEDQTISPKDETAAIKGIGEKHGPSQLSLRTFPVENKTNGGAESRSSSVHAAANGGSSSKVANGNAEAGHDPEEDDAQETDEAYAPGSIGYHRVHRRTLSTTSKQSNAERLGRITASLDFANNSKVKGEITAAALEMLRQQSGNKAAGSLAGSLAGLNGTEGASTAGLFTGTIAGEGDDDVLDFHPYIFHAPHEPVPMALVNRRPHGTPGHTDIRNPQDAAWLAGFRYAQKHVLIQSPTLNAAPVRAAVLACVKRKVRVELWLDLGFNDKSESMPFQGGTNEKVVTSLYRHLRQEGKGNEKFLEVFWYTGKDMTRPLNAVRKQRNCHVKFAAFDEQVCVAGSGNQDTQSWYHSQE